MMNQAQQTKPAQEMVMVELVLDRPVHKDLLYGTNQEWDGPGDVKPIPEALWPKFAIHTDVYRLAAFKEMQSGLAQKVETQVSESFDLLTDQQVRAAAAERGIKLHNKIKGETLRAAFAEKSKAVA
jgi:hypothetical protein